MRTEFKKTVLDSVLQSVPLTLVKPIMLCFIYKSLKINELYLFLDKKDDFSALPEALLTRVGKLAFVMALELTPERKLAREDSQKVLVSLQEKGFFVQMPPSTTSLLPAL